MSASVSAGAAARPLGTEDGRDVIVVDNLQAMHGDRVILDGITFSVSAGETLVVVGASGCGKSTLLRCLIGLHVPSRGVVRILGHDIEKIERRELDVLRRKMGVAFQSSALLNSLSVGDNVSLPLREHTALDEATISIMTRMKLEQVGLRGVEDLLPSELSGGMRKRAGIARALAMDPQVLFLDEPSAGLDPITAAGLDELLIKLNKAMGLTTVVVTHEIQSIRKVADRVLMIDEGRIRLDGTLEDVQGSRDPRVRQFFDRQPDADDADDGASLVTELTR